MPLHVWLSFIAAATVLLLIPGPTVLQCIGDALANNQRQNWATVLGVGVGDAVAMSLSLLGAGALLNASSLAFTTMKTIGGLYLLYLGIKAIVSTKKAAKEGAGNEDTLPLEPRSESALLRFSKASMITMLNPKSILFFVAFVPQFINTTHSFASQATVLLTTFVSLAMLNAWGYMFFAAALGHRLRSKAAQTNVGYASGGVLLGAGALTLALKRR